MFIGYLINILHLHSLNLLCNCLYARLSFWKPDLDNRMYTLTSLFLCFPQLRQTVRKFCAEKLAPQVDEIDKSNEFPGMRVSWNTA